MTFKKIARLFGNELVRFSKEFSSHSRCLRQSARVTTNWMKFYSLQIADVCYQFVRLSYEYRWDIFAYLYIDSRRRDHPPDLIRQESYPHLLRPLSPFPSLCFEWLCTNAMIHPQAMVITSMPFLHNMSVETFLFLPNLCKEFDVSVSFRLPWVLLGSSPSFRKGSYTGNKYLSISLISCICKVMEMVNGRLMWYIERGNHLSLVQHSFRKQGQPMIPYYPYNPLSVMPSPITIARSVFFDLEKAYDTACFWHFDFMSLVCSVICLLISDRLYLTVFKRVDWVSAFWYPWGGGVTQGSILKVARSLLWPPTAFSVYSPWVFTDLFMLPLVEMKAAVGTERYVKVGWNSRFDVITRDDYDHALLPFSVCPPGFRPLSQVSQNLVCGRGSISMSYFW